MSRMVAETASFLAILATIIASFAVGLFNIYQPYRGYTRHKDDDVIVQSDAFTTLFSAMINLYWGFFGYTPPNYAQVVLPEEKIVIGNQTIIVYNEHTFTETIGTGVLAVYYLFCVVVLLNMLIAMLTNAYTNVLLNADMEWKFNRTKVGCSFQFCLHIHVHVTTTVALLLYYCFCCYYCCFCYFCCCFCFCYILLLLLYYSYNYYY